MRKGTTGELNSKINLNLNNLTNSKPVVTKDLKIWMKKSKGSKMNNRIISGTKSQQDQTIL